MQLLFAVFTSPTGFGSFLGDFLAFGGREASGSGFAALQTAHASERNSSRVLLWLGLGFLSNLINDRLGKSVYVCA